MLNDKVKISSIKPDLYLVIGVILAFLTALLGEYAFIILLIIFLFLAVQKWGDSAILFLSIILYLTFISDVLHSLRIIIQLFGFILLSYIFLKKYGFSFHRYPRIPRILAVFLAVYYTSIILSTIFSQYFFTGIQQLMKQSIFFIIVYMIFSFLDNLKELKVVLSSLVLAAAIVAASILYEYSANGFNIVDYVQGIQIRITGLFSNINAAGTYFGAVFPITLITGLTIKQKKYKTLFIALNIFLFLGIVFTTSRSAYFSTMISVLFMLYILNKRLLYKLIITCSILAAIILLIPQLNEFFSLFFRIESGLSQRDHLWELSLKMIKDNPIFGIGPGAYSYEMLNYFPVLLNTWVGERLIQLRDLTFGANNSHNFFLFMASDMGNHGYYHLIFITNQFFPNWVFNN